MEKPHRQRNFRLTELDPELLSTPFGVQTNWHVITGAPCCGKTTLIDQLANQGFQTVPEGARRYIERDGLGANEPSDPRESGRPTAYDQGYATADLACIATGGCRLS